VSNNPTSPFSGIKLSDQTTIADRGSDQQLFSPALRQTPVSVHPNTPTRDQQPTHLPRKEGSQEPRRVGTLPLGKPEATINAATSNVIERPLFDINVPATEKNSYMFSQEELWALRDTESELERTYRTDVSKYNIIRLGLHYLLENYQKHKRSSFLVRRLGLGQ